MATELEVRVQGRLRGRPSLWLGARLLVLSAWLLRRVGVEVRINQGPWERVWPRRELISVSATVGEPAEPT